ARIAGARTPGSSLRIVDPPCDKRGSQRGGRRAAPASGIAAHTDGRAAAGDGPRPIGVETRRICTSQAQTLGYGERSAGWCVGTLPDAGRGAHRLRLWAEIGRVAE